MDQKMPLDVLHQHEMAYIRKYLDRHGENGTYTDQEIDSFLSGLDAVDEIPPPEEPWFDFEQLRSLYENVAKVWQDCLFAKSLTEIFETITSDCLIKKCICVGLGQPSANFLVWDIDGVPESFEDLEHLKKYDFRREAKRTLLEPRLLKGETRHSIPQLQLAAFKWMGDYCTFYCLVSGPITI